MEILPDTLRKDLATSVFRNVGEGRSVADFCALSGFAKYPVYPAGLTCWPGFAWYVRSGVGCPVCPVCHVEPSAEFYCCVKVVSSSGVSSSKRFVSDLTPL